MADQPDVVKRAYQKDKFNASKLEELEKCMSEPMYFIRTYVKIQHPTKGMVPFEIYPYQENILDCFANNKYVIAMCGRQMGKTTCAAAYILWRALFNPDQTILIAANKFVQAMEIMDRIRYSYETLPDWLRAGVVEYNKGTITFDNGSSIISRATSPDAGRGLSISLLYLDEFAFVRPTIATEFWTAMQPTLSTGGDCIITSTPNNDEDQFAQIWFAARNTVDENGEDIPGGVGRNGFKSILVKWDEHPERDAVFEKKFRGMLGDDKFDREFNCDFISADDTLINPQFLKNGFTSKEPVQRTGHIHWFSPVKPNRQYAVSLDPAMGTGFGDYSAIQVFSLPDMEQVAEWRSQSAQAPEQVRILLQILTYIHNSLRSNPEHDGDPEIFWTIENNSLGEAVLQVINDTGEDNFPGWFVHEPKKAGMGRRRKGLTTTPRSKLLACSKIKHLIESRRMTINSKHLISEFKNFVMSGNSYAAKIGLHDDLISATLLIVRIIQIVSQHDMDMYEQLNDAIDVGGIDSDPMPITF